MIENLEASLKNKAGLQALLISQAPRVLGMATTLLRRHPVLFLGGVVIAAVAWKKGLIPRSIQKDPADLVH